MREVLAHLLDVHGYRHLAFIRGPEGHREADERYRAYVETLAETGLPLDPTLVACGDLGTASGEAAIQLLLDQRKTHFEAVVVASAAMALGVLAALQSRGIRVPDDVAVASFDDIEEASFAMPPLTTVRQPLYEQGRRAAEMLLALLEGKEVSKQVTLPTELVVRQSCGCPSQAVRQASVEAATTGETFEAALAAQRACTLLDMAQAVGDHPADTIPGWAERFLDTFVAELKGESSDVFLPALHEILRQVRPESGDIASWHGALSALRRHVLSFLADSEMVSRAENLCQQARVLIGEAMQRAQACQRLQSEQRTGVLNEIGQALVTTSDVAELMNVAAQQLPHLGIRSCYVSLYDGPGTPPEWSRLVLAYDQNTRVEVEAGGRRFLSRQLVPGDLLPHERRYTMMVEALHFRENQFGLALLEMGPREGTLYETLRGQLSSALRGVVLLEERKRGEEALTTERNLLHTLLDSLPDYIYAKDAEGRFVLANKAVAHQIGFTTPDELLGKTDFDLFPRELAEQYHAEEQAIIRSGQGLYDYEGRTLDAGQERWVSTNKVPLRDAQGRITGFVGVGRDITEHKAAEVERERLLAILEHRSAQLQAAAEISRVASSILDPDELTQQVVDVLGERFDLYYVGLLLVDWTGEWTGEQGKWVVLRAATGAAGRQLTAQGYRTEIDSVSMIGWCALNKKPHIAGDVTTDAVYLEHPALPETRSEMTLPLKVGERLIGVLDVQSRQVGAFDEDDIAVLQTVADQLAVAVENARAVAGMRHLNEDLQRTMEMQAQLLETIRILSTPVMPLLKGAVLLPLVGHVDSVRAYQIMEQLLAGVEKYHARIAIVDITGVSVIDTAVADSLLRAARATNLLGAEVVVVGMRPEVAQTIVELGVDFSTLITVSDLQSGIEYVLRRLGTEDAAR
jgi:PAS domain S-box-containing protein